MFAVISDIHSNLEALQVVMDDIDRRGLKEVFCLGDVVGYGASPKECLDLVIERCQVTLCGNHDHAVFYEPSNFNVSAERACYWTRHVFEEETNKAKRDQRWEFLGRLPTRAESKGLFLVHASPRRPVNEYLFAEDVYTNPGKVLANFERLGEGQLGCVVGHTHVPGVFLDDPYFDPPGELPETNRYAITREEKAIINVGSVGQPRDRDSRACYVVVYERGDPLPPADTDSLVPSRVSPEDEEYWATVEFVRLEYDIDKAVKKILSVPDLDDFLGTRLLDGR